MNLALDAQVGHQERFEVVVPAGEQGAEEGGDHTQHLGHLRILRRVSQANAPIVPTHA